MKITDYRITTIDKGLVNGLYVVEERCSHRLFAIRTYKDPSHQIFHGNGASSYTLYHDDGTIKSGVFHIDGKIYRDNDLPPFISYYPDGTICQQKWLNSNGELNRDVGPSYISYYSNGNVCEEGFYTNGNLHNISGPSIKKYKLNGSCSSKQYHVNGKSISESKFYEKYLPQEYDRYIREKIYVINNKKYKITNSFSKQLILTEI